MLTVEHYSKDGKSLVYVHIDIFFGLSTNSQVGKILPGFLLSDASQDGIVGADVASIIGQIWDIMNLK